MNNKKRPDVVVGLSLLSSLVFCPHVLHDVAILIDADGGYLLLRRYRLKEKSWGISC